MPFPCSHYRTRITRYSNTIQTLWSEIDQIMEEVPYDHLLILHRFERICSLQVKIVYLKNFLSVLSYS